MTRNRNNKRNQRRARNHEGEKRAHEAASMIMGAALCKALDRVFGNHPTKTKDLLPPSDKPFNGIRKVSDTHIDCGVCIPTDGTAKEIPVPEGFQVFISEDGKPMIRKKVEGDGEPKNTFTPTAYYQLAKDLYQGSRPYYWNVNTDNESEAIDTYECNADFDCLFNCYTEAQVKRLMAFNKLQNIAIWLNDGWKPNFDDDSLKFCICKCFGKLIVAHNTNANEGLVYFKTKELAEQAIAIMGSSSLADLFNTNW